MPTRPTNTMNLGRCPLHETLGRTTVGCAQQDRRRAAVAFSPCPFPGACSPPLLAPCPPRTGLCPSRWARFPPGRSRARCPSSPPWGAPPWASVWTPRGYRPSRAPVRGSRRKEEEEGGVNKEKFCSLDSGFSFVH